MAKRYVVAHTLLGTGHTGGQEVKESDFDAATWEHFQAIGAIRELDPDNPEDAALATNLDIVEERQEKQQKASKRAGRTPEETAADVDAQAQRGESPV